MKKEVAKVLGKAKEEAYKEGYEAAKAEIHQTGKVTTRAASQKTEKPK